MAITISPALIVHPGEWLRTEIVAAYALNVSDAARHLRVTRQALSALLNSRAGVSPDMAIRFEKAFGVSANTLIRMQAAYDLKQARARADAIDVKRVPLAA